MILLPLELGHDGIAIPLGNIHARLPIVQNALWGGATGGIANENQVAQWQNMIVKGEPFNEPVIVVLHEHAGGNGRCVNGRCSCIYIA